MKIFLRIVNYLFLIICILVGFEANAEYSKVSNNGNTIPESSPAGLEPDAWGCTYDSNTQLMWEVKTDNNGLRDKDWTYSWYSEDSQINDGFAGYENRGQCFDTSNCDIDKFVTQINAQKLCQASDWRLPTIDELKTLVYCSSGEPLSWNTSGNSCTGSYQRPTIDLTFFNNTTEANYWSLSPSSTDSGLARYASFYFGNAFNQAKSKLNYVRLVRTAGALSTGSTTTNNSPQPFSFIPQLNVASNNVVVSNTIQISGLDITAPISIDNGEYRINTGTWTGQDGAVNNGDIIEVRHTSSSTPNTTVLATLTIGTESAIFSSTTKSQEEPVSSQGDGFIEGNIYDACNGKPLDFVNLQFAVGKTQQSDENGRYKYKLPGGNYTVVAAFEGYVTDSRNITITPDQIRYADFPLAPPGGCSAVGHASSYKAIVVAAGGPLILDQVNHIWSATQQLTDKAFKALKLQGFGDNNIYYLSADPTPHDADGDGINDIDAIADLNTLEYALTQWSTDVEDVVIYLIGHGGIESLHIDREEKLTASQLKQWLDTLQNNISGKQSVIIDACFSGSFIPPLSAQNRYILTSTSRDLKAVVSNEGGSNSFSYHFWDEVVFSGQLGDAFRKARQSMSDQLVGNALTQKATLDTNGDRSETSADYDIISQYCFGQCKQNASFAPIINSIEPQGNLNGKQIVSVQVVVNASNPIDKAWVTILRPDYNFPTDDSAINTLPQIDLDCQLESCLGSYNNFNLNGEYVLTFYVQDNQGNLSVPRSVHVEQAGRDDREWFADAVYDSTNGLLTLKDVEYAGSHYYIEFLDQGDFAFSLDYLQALTTSTRGRPATFDGKFLKVPSVFASGNYYKVDFSQSGDFVFHLNNVELNNEN